MYLVHILRSFDQSYQCLYQCLSFTLIVDMNEISLFKKLQCIAIDGQNINDQSFNLSLSGNFGSTFQHLINYLFQIRVG